MNWNLIWINEVENDRFTYNLYFDLNNQNKLFDFLKSINLPEPSGILEYQVYDTEEDPYVDTKIKNSFYINVSKNDFNKIKEKLFLLQRKEKLKNLKNE